MSIIGAAVVPAIHGYVSDTLGSFYNWLLLYQRFALSMLDITSGIK